MLQCNNDCDKLLNKQEVINLINYAISSNELLFVGAIIYISKAIYDANFTESGLGQNEFSKWALANGNNGTENWTGRIPITLDPGVTELDTPNKIGGTSTITLVTDNIPAHTHTVSTIAHSHTLTIPSHNHTATASTSLSGTETSTLSGSGSNVVTGDVDLLYETIPIEPTGGSAIDVLVEPTSTLGGPTGTYTATISNGDTTIGNHTHDLDVDHIHTISINNGGGSVESTSEVGSENLVSTSVGSGTSFNILNPFIVVVPIQKIS